MEELSNRMQEPVNLNVATREQLEQFPFLSDIQIEHLLAYIYIHGQMKTIYELQLVEEMDRQTIQYLLPFVCIKAINNEPAFRWKSLLKSAAKYGKNELLTRFDIPFYRRKGYEHTYLGPSVYNSVKYSFRYSDRLYAGVVAEKDAGEPFGALHNRYGYDYYSFYLLLKDCGRLKALAIGNYRLSFGQGLVISTDYLMGKTIYASSFNNRSGGIKKHSSTDEYNYFRGVAATVSLAKDWDMSGFYSHRSLDGVITDGAITSIYKTGLHRSQKEADKKNLFTMQLTGGNVSYQHNRIRLGITGIYYLFNRPYEPELTGYSKYNLHGNNFYRGSFDGKEYHGIMYGALDDNGQQIGTPFKSSKFGKAFGYEALQKKFTASTEKVKKNNLTERARQEIIKAMQNIGTKEDFARRLKEADIEVVYRTNPEGRLYGITFIDHTTRTVFNGSRLGKAFSANVFNELFNNPDADRERLIPQPEQEPSRQEREAKAEERQEGAEYRQQENQSQHQSESSDSLIDTSALGAVDIFSILMEDDHTHEYIDPAFRYGRRKKKKRRRRL